MGQFMRILGFNSDLMGLYWGLLGIIMGLSGYLVTYWKIPNPIGYFYGTYWDGEVGRELFADGEFHLSIEEV